MSWPKKDGSPSFLKHLGPFRCIEPAIVSENAKSWTSRFHQFFRSRTSTDQTVQRNWLLWIFHRPWIYKGLWKIAKNQSHLVKFGCGNPGPKKLVKPKISTFGVFTQYCCFNASKWPQMLQKWRRTILFGSGHTLGTLKHGLGSLCYCFITIFGVGGSLAPPGAP